MKMNEVILPNGWAMATVGDVADEAVERSGPVSNEFIYVDISSIDREQKCILDAKVVETTVAPSRARQVLQSGDVLISMTRPNLNAIAMVTPEFHGAIGSTGFHVLRSKWVEPKFLFYLVHTREFIEKMCLCVQGALYPAVRPNDIASFSFSLPSRPEQHRIVAKIEELFSELDKGIENLKIARAQLKVYRQALLKHAFEGKLTAQWRAENQDKLETADALLKRIQQERAQRYQQQLADWQTNGGSKPKAPKPLPPLTAEELAEFPELPEGWGWVRIIDLIADSTLGLDRGAQYQNSEPPGLPYIKMNNVTMDGRVTSDKLVYVDVDKTEQERYVLREGDILFNTRNSRELVGKTGLVRKFVVPTVYNNNLMRIRLHDGISPYFVCHQMCSAGFKKKLEEAKKGTTNVAAVYAKDLFPLLLVLAPQLEQQRIVELVEARLSEVDQLDQTITTSLQQAEALRQSILKKAFSGQLVPQDPHDEPASALLARIRAEREQSDCPKRGRKAA